MTDILGYAHFGEHDVSQDILTTVSQRPGSQGFTPPLGPGDYSFWVRQGGADAATWDLNFVVTSTNPVGGGAVVPESSSIAMFGIGVLGLFGYSAGRRQTSTAA